MLDYRALQALNAVIQTQGFESAAKKLFITQSAISQRISALENYYGKPLLIRTLPYRPTTLGEALLGHYKRTLLLEEELSIKLSKTLTHSHISIAINRDSLETWFMAVIDKMKSIADISLEIISDDQEVTLDYLRKGLVSACLSTTEKPITNCVATFLGYMDYILVASPAFYKKYFKDKKSIKKNLLKAPAVIFDNKDYLHARYLKHFFKINHETPKYHTVPSVTGFRKFAIHGYAYALIPKIDIVNELNKNKLISILPNKPWKMPLYWHHWAIESEAYKNFNDLVIGVAKEKFEVL